MNELSVNTQQKSLDIDNNNNSNNNNNNNNNNIINTISPSEQQQQQQQHNINETGVGNELYWENDDDYYDDNTNKDCKRKTIRNSAQDAKFYTPPASPTQEEDNDKYDKYFSFSDKSSSISQDSNNNSTTGSYSKNSLNSKEGDGATSFGGILVTTVQVVEVSKNQKNNNPLQRNDNDNVNNSKYNKSILKNTQQQQVTFSANNSNDNKSIVVDNTNDISFHEQQQLKKHQKRLSVQTMKDRRKSRIYNDFAFNKLIQKFDEAQKEYSEIKLVRTHSSKRARQPKRSNNVVYRKTNKSRPKLPLVNAPTSNPSYSNDPTDMDEDLPPIKYQFNRWIPETDTPPKLIHASLVPLSVHQERLSMVQQDDNDINDNNNSDNDKENEQITTEKVEPTRPLVTRIAKLKILNRNSHKRLMRVNSKRKQKRVSVIIPRQQRASQIFRQNVLEQSVFLSFNGNVTTGNPQFYPNGNLNNTNDNNNDNTNINHDKSNVVYNNSSDSTHNRNKSLRRQKVRKSVIVERELKKDRRRKEKKKIDKTLGDDKSGHIVREILDNEVLEQRIKEDLLTKQRMMAPRPPPRRATTDLHLLTEINQSSDTTTASTFKRHMTTSSLLIASVPDRRSVKSEVNSRSLYKPTDSPTFPSHLSRHSYSTENPNLVTPPLPPPSPQQLL